MHWPTQARPFSRTPERKAERCYATLSAESVDQALVLLESVQPVDLLFIDLKLQGDNEAGLALATEAVKKRPREARARERHRHRSSGKSESA
ncbi:MAG TPA: hypothetical protein VF452_20880 [Candidatus Binatia bacterium]|jgi:CheY-like chemotaxis protein